MISKTDILLLHKFVILDFGGADGVREESLLLSAISRPFQTFDGKELYPSPLAKAAALAESIIINHPFIDGNKRLGAVVMLAMLQEYQIPFLATQDELYNMVISVSTGETRFEEIVEWLRSRCG